MEIHTDTFADSPSRSRSRILLIVLCPRRGLLRRRLSSFGQFTELTLDLLLRRWTLKALEHPRGLCGVVCLEARSAAQTILSAHGKDGFSPKGNVRRRVPYRSQDFNHEEKQDEDDVLFLEDCCLGGSGEGWGVS